jgi:chemotaxis response regulator CheB
MPVELITEGLLFQPNRVFIIPAQRDLHVLDGEFRLKPISKPRGWPDVITVFRRSLTRHWDGKLIAVNVSGYDGDGAAALCGIKDVGGITIAQKLETAGEPDSREKSQGILGHFGVRRGGLVCLVCSALSGEVLLHQRPRPHDHGEEALVGVGGGQYRCR